MQAISLKRLTRASRRFFSRSKCAIAKDRAPFKPVLVTEPVEPPPVVRELLDLFDGQLEEANRC